MPTNEIRYGKYIIRSCSCVFILFGPKNHTNGHPFIGEFASEAVAKEAVDLFAEMRMPPHPRGTIKMLRERGHTVIVRETRSGSLRYKLDNERERTALELSNRLRKLHGVG